MTGQKKPLVSIVIPVYNGANYLREAIESALAQTYENIEVLVVNDGSNDGGATERIALSYGDQIRYFRKENGGVASALNRGIREMRGEYFSWLSHDDVYYPHKIEVQMNYVDTHTLQNVVLYGDYDVVDEKGNIVYSPRLPEVPPSRFRYFITTHSMVHGCTLLIPRACINRTGCFNEALKTTQDYDFWFRMASRFNFIHLSNTLLKSRSHEAQGTKTMSSVVVQECNDLMIRFFSELTPEEFKRGAGIPFLFLAKWKVAQTFKKRGFHEAYQFAMREIGMNLLTRKTKDISR